MAPIRAVLADDHRSVLHELSRLLAPYVEILAVAGDGAALVEAVRRERPDLVITDISMPVMSGIEAMAVLRAEHVNTPFVLLTIHADPRLAAKAMAVGAAGYVIKEAAAHELPVAIAKVMAGEIYITPSLARR